jgi:cytochrome b
MLVKVWDLPTRLFHWMLVVSFFTAYLTEDDYLSIHTKAGYTIIGLLCFRIMWGFIGTKHARFRDFVVPPKAALIYLKQSSKNEAPTYLGHNPAGGLMIIALLVCLTLTTMTGLATYATEEARGPLVALMDLTPNYIFDATEDVHEFFANLTLALIAFHLLGVLVGSLYHKEDLVQAMVTGYKFTINDKPPST